MCAASNVMIPTLRACEPEVAQYAQTTCFEAGYMVKTNSGWRAVRPVLNASACTGCLQCYLYCPDGAILRAADPARPQASGGVTHVQGSGPAVAFDYDFCKGCGICVRECKFGALAMVPERKGE